ARLPGNLPQGDRFFVRNPAPPRGIEVASWRLSGVGAGVREPVTYTYADLWKFPLVWVVRTLECAGNRRKHFAESCGRRFEGTPWGRGAISTAEWTGVRLRDLVEPAAIAPRASHALPHALHAARPRRP